MVAKHFPGSLVVVNLFPGAVVVVNIFPGGSDGSQSFPHWAMVVAKLFPVGQCW